MTERPDGKEREMEPPDTYVTGLRNTSISISGTWSGDPFTELLFDAATRRRMSWTPSLRRLFGVDWWERRYTFDVSLAHWDPENLEASFQMASSFDVEFAERWRRAGWHVLRFLRLA